MIRDIALQAIIGDLERAKREARMMFPLLLEQITKEQIIAKFEKAKNKYGGDLDLQSMDLQREMLDEAIDLICYYAMSRM